MLDSTISIVQMQIFLPDQAISMLFCRMSEKKNRYTEGITCFWDESWKKVHVIMKSMSYHHLVEYLKFLHIKNSVQ